MKYYHGGPANVKMILPASETGAFNMEDAGVSESAGNRPDRVYITTDQSVAFALAALAPFRKVAVHEVEPIGELEKDPDAKMEDGFRCPRARVVKSWKLSRNQREKVLRALSK